MVVVLLTSDIIVELLDTPDCLTGGRKAEDDEKEADEGGWNFLKRFFTHLVVFCCCFSCVVFEMW